MSAVSLSASGTFKTTGDLLERCSNVDIVRFLNDAGKRGVKRLEEATPKDTGKTASMWTYKIHTSQNGASIEWWNDNVNNGVPIALVIEYGHGTRNGGYVAPYPYIEEALAPIMRETEENVFKQLLGAYSDIVRGLATTAFH